MTKYRIGLVRVITIHDEEKLHQHGRLIEQVFPELKVISKCIKDQPKGIYDAETEEIAKPKILQMVEEFQKDRVDAIIISCAIDPAVSEAREKIKIPVIGSGSAAASLALSMGEKIGVIKLTEEVPQSIKRILGENLVAEEHPANVRNTTDLMTQEGEKASIEALKKLVEKGVDAVVLACTGYSTIGFVKKVQKFFPIPIIEPVVASGAAALSILRQLEFGRT
ncbi:MAG: aspartate/glutamate racemase family protein [Candidatus Caldarchaeum sp.]|uniref:Hydantoin racemase n=1 Tax=Caldiarchaeum subterraneum TaxID=311458 RepID=A0A7C5U675_CALS0